jgi:thioredoxin reductase
MIKALIAGGGVAGPGAAIALRRGNREVPMKACLSQCPVSGNVI